MSTTIAWMAGLIDGEGSIYFNVITRKSKRKFGNRIAITPSFSIAMSEGKWFQTIKHIFDDLGLNYNTRFRTYGTGCKMAEISIYARPSLKKLLTTISPYSVIKKPHIGVMLEYISMGPIGRRNQYMGYDMVDMKKRAELVGKIQSRNIRKNRHFKWTEETIINWCQEYNDTH